MIISCTSYTKFLANWESWRMYKGLGYVPIERKPALERGSALHYLAEGYFHNWTPEQYLEIQREEDISPSGWEAGELLWPTLKEYIDMRPGKLIAAEPCDPGKKGIIVPIPDTPHSIEVRLDGIYEQDGVFTVDEYKSTGPRKKLWEVEKEWTHNPQKNFVIIGARHYLQNPNITDVNVITVQEGTPPTILGPIPIQVDDYDVTYQMRSAAMVCDVIEFLIGKYGLDTPWVHNIPNQWTCWKCDYADICGQQLSGCPEGFTQREDCMKNLLSL